MFFSSIVTAANYNGPTNWRQALDKRSRERIYTYSGGRYVDQAFRYRLFYPQPFDPTQQYPLIIWLHGGGDGGSDNLSHLKHIDATLYRDGLNADAHFFVFALQKDRHNRDGGWTGESQAAAGQATAKGDDMLSVAWEISQFLIETLPVDSQRVSAVGISSGGSACWELAFRYPDKLAAVLPMAAGGAPQDKRRRLTKTPIWAFHATNDSSTPVNGVRETVTHLDQLGGNVRLTETDDEGHDCWTTAFAEHDLLYWLLSQRCDSSNALKPGAYRPVVAARIMWNKAWPRLIPLGLLATLIWASIRHKRHSRTSPHPNES